MKSTMPSARAIPQPMALTLFLGFCLLAGSSVGAPVRVARAAVPATHDPYYTDTCRDLTTFAYWATFNIWVDRRRSHHGPEKDALERARDRVRAIKDMPPGNVAIVEETAANAFGATRETINQRDAQEAQENALVTAVDVYDECIRNKGVLTD